MITRWNRLSGARFLSKRVFGSFTDVSINRNFSRFLTGFKFIQKGQVKNNLRELAESGIGIGGYSSLMAYIDLQHPLLDKYDFNLNDFVLGAEHGYKDIMQCLYSEDFIEYCNGKNDNSPSARFLDSICVDDAFSHLQEEVLGGNGGGRQYAVTKEKFTHLAVASLRIAVVHKPETAQDYYGVMTDVEVNYESQVSYFDRNHQNHHLAPSHMKSSQRTRSWVYTGDISLGSEQVVWKLKRCIGFAPSEVGI